MKTQFLVLACSNKPGGKCLAGIRLGETKLIRPIGSEHNGAVSRISCQPSGLGRSLRPLDIIEFELADEATPTIGQPENFRIEGGGSIKYVRTISYKKNNL